MADDDAALPKTTVRKLLKEAVPEGMRVTPDVRDVISECLVEFVHLIASQANDISDKQGKKTIMPMHLIGALERLGFGKAYTAEAHEQEHRHKEAVEALPSSKNKRRRKDSAVPDEELLRQQQELFAQSSAALVGEADVPTVSLGI